MKIVAISDTHSKHDEIQHDIPDGDVLVHAGDMSMIGAIEELSKFNKWLGQLPHKYKILIAGNHDWLFERNSAKARDIMTSCIYLQDEEVVIEGVKFYGSPWQPAFHNWAFNLHKPEQLADKWREIPLDTDVLITHGPPLGVNDLTHYGDTNVGCGELLKAINARNIEHHVFGHIHEGYGSIKLANTHFHNAAICNLKYRPVNKPIVFTIKE